MFQNKLSVVETDLNSKSSYKRSYYLISEVDNFLNNLAMYDYPILKCEVLYLEAKGISQAKLREAGFKITRSKDKADIIILENPMSTFDTYMETHYRPSKYDYNFTSFTEALVEEEEKGYKYMWKDQLYKYLYKYEGNVELFNNINDLLNSNTNKNPTDANTKIAMEFMTNADWTNNKLYLIELFNLHWWDRIRPHEYRSSVSFKGFLDSLDFLYENVYLQEANDYREYCITEDHHNWVYNKFESEFVKKLQDLAESYKITIDKIEYSIDKTVHKKGEN